MTKSTITLLVLLLPIACEQAEAKRASPQTAAAKPDATPPASVTPAKTAAPAPTPVATKAASTPSTAPTRPPDVPADWQPIVGDVWSFWVPSNWKVSPWTPSEGAGHPDDRQAAAQRSEGGMEIATLDCTLQSDAASPSHASLQKTVIERAKAEAKNHEAKVAEVEVDHGGTKHKAVEVEYAASGDGTHVLARWVAGTRTFGLVCTDQSGTNAPADLELLKLAIGSLRWS